MTFLCNSIRTIFIRKRWKYSHIPSFLIRIYIIKEITASTGYDLDEETHNVTVTKDQTVKDNSNEISGDDPNIVRIQIV